MDDYYTPESCTGCPAKIVCRCLCVTEAEIVDVITRLELRTIRELKTHVGAGDGCSCCHPLLNEYLERTACVHA